MHEQAHSAGVVTFSIVAKGREYWLEVSGEDGSRRFIQRFDNEDTAVQQMRWLQLRADRRASETPKPSPSSC
jgi:hypothetical protein